ncbi:MAG: tetratricopeptide repeat protein [Acidobacteria bacterium]|nr:tetratricopeptide repeat protein [Acidobacteriota bacterium]
MKTIHLIIILLVLFAFAALGNLYLTNHELLNRELLLPGDTKAKIWWVILGIFALGFLLNLVWTAGIETYRALKGLGASAATRAGQKLETRLREVRELMAHGQFTKARTQLGQILEDWPDNLGANFLRGEVLMKLGEGPEAIQHFEAMRSKFPALVEVRYQLADALVAGRRGDEALEILRKLAHDHPKLALRALRRLRAIHADAGRWEEALEAHKKLAGAFPAELNQAERAQGVALVFQVGLLKVDSDQFKEATQVFQQVIKEDPQFGPAYLSLGRCMILQDQEAQGLELWLEGFRATGEGAFLQEVEDYFIQSGRPEEGLALLRRVSASSEHATTAKFFLGKMHYRLEMLEEALDLFQEVRSQVVYSPILFFFMAKIHARRGRLEPALNEYRQLLRNLGILKMRYECAVCGHRSQEYGDRCESCSSWNSVHFLFKESELPEFPLRPESGSWILGA